MNCLNCGHEVHKNYYGGGYTHAYKLISGNGQDECAAYKTIPTPTSMQPTPCSCNKPKGD